MAITIFYSWQSDRPSNLNRNFIEDALDKAIKKLGQDIKIQEALRDVEVKLDKDTKGVPGTPPITEEIFNKILKCSVFVPDLTFVGKSVKNRPLQNPNVLIEYGYALNALSYSRMLPVMNIAFGEPTENNMPFNMRHLRHPIKYHLDDNEIMSVDRKNIKENLIKDFYDALQVMAKSGILTYSDESQKEFEGIPFTSNPSTFLQPGETFLDNRRFRRGNETLELPEVQRIFLRIIPKKPIDNLKSNEIENIARNGNLMPMSEVGVSCSYGRNKYGAYACADEDGLILNFTQLFKNGELWGIDTDLLDKNRLIERAGVRFGFFPCVAFERTFIWALNNYLQFAKDILKLQVPIKFIAGATDILGYRMTAPPGMHVIYERFIGNMVENDVTFEGIIDDYSKEAHKILRPFFERVWEECGLERPDKDILGR